MKSREFVVFCQEIIDSAYQKVANFHKIGLALHIDRFDMPPELDSTPRSDDAVGGWYNLIVLKPPDKRQNLLLPALIHLVMAVDIQNDVIERKQAFEVSFNAVYGICGDVIVQLLADMHILKKLPDCLALAKKELLNAESVIFHPADMDAAMKRRGGEVDVVPGEHGFIQILGKTIFYLNRTQSSRLLIQNVINLCIAV